MKRGKRCCWMVIRMIFISNDSDGTEVSVAKKTCVHVMQDSVGDQQGQDNQVILMSHQDWHKKLHKWSIQEVHRQS